MMAMEGQMKRKRSVFPSMISRLMNCFKKNSGSENEERRPLLEENASGSSLKIEATEEASNPNKERISAGPDEADAAKLQGKPESSPAAIARAYMHSRVSAAPKIPVGNSHQQRLSWSWRQSKFAQSAALKQGNVFGRKNQFKHQSWLPVHNQMLKRTSSFLDEKPLSSKNGAYVSRVRRKLSNSSTDVHDRTRSVLIRNSAQGIKLNFALAPLQSRQTAQKILETLDSLHVGKNKNKSNSGINSFDSTLLFSRSRSSSLFSRYASGKADDAAQQSLSTALDCFQKR